MLFVVKDFDLVSEFVNFPLAVVHFLLVWIDQLPDIDQQPLRGRQVSLRNVLDPQIHSLRLHSRQHLTDFIQCLLNEGDLPLGMNNLRASPPELSQHFLYFKLILFLNSELLSLPHPLALRIFILQVPDLLIFLRQLVLIDLLDSFGFHWGRLPHVIAPRLGLSVRIDWIGGIGLVVAVVEPNASIFEEPEFLGGEGPWRDVVLPHEVVIFCAHLKLSDYRITIK